MNIEIVNVKITTVPTAKGSYQKAEVAYKRDGKLEGKPIVSYNHKNVFEVISKAREGEFYDVTTEKNDKGYWDWTNATSSTGVKSGTSQDSTNGAVGKTVRSTYETPDERAAKQVYIVRQSSISNAIEFHGIHKNKVSVSNIIETAREFEAYVFSKDGGDRNSLAKIEDDIPF